MASRFLAVYGPPAALEGFAANLSLNVKDMALTFESDSLLFFTNDAVRAIPLSSGQGVVFGHAFTRTLPHQKVTNLPPETSSDIVRTDGLSLVKSVWGGYIAFVLGGAQTRLCVIRDPSGTVPCLMVGKQALWIFASDLHALIDNGLYQPRIDWQNLKQHLRVPDLKTGRTALSGCHEVLPGERLAVREDGLHRSYVWNPWDYTAPINAETEEIAAALTETVTQTVRAWAGSFNNILLGVSGGLDSSVLAACLSGQGATWSGVTFATKHIDGDERPFAQLLARHLAFDLFERHHEVDEVDITLSGSAHLPLPSGLPYAQSHDHAKQKLATQNDFDAFFTGQGGDNVFGYMMSAIPLIDRMRSKGLTPALWETFCDLCTLTESSYWSVGKAANRAYRDRLRPYTWSARAVYLTDFKEPPKLEHFWLDAPPQSLAGKGVHIAKILRILNTVDGYDRRHFGPLITPLTAQPILELALSIPTWEWCRTGINRMPVRDAFRPALPAELVERVSKAGPNSFAFEVIERNAVQMTDFLCEGKLAARGLLDVRAIRESLQTPQLIRPPLHIDLMRLCEVEAWVRHWDGQMTASP
ncbi:asparagine synthase-related protein [Asticcacaulis sp. W401b]|uniref:asparagine synthase-related protein n=1 Tax=Asticcacaulis sp. W401b TaxID=3388666 RepID=UPI00397094A2